VIEIFEYDTTRVRFREWAQSVLEIEDLESLHLHECAGPSIRKIVSIIFSDALKSAFAGPIGETPGEFVGEYATPKCRSVRGPRFTRNSASTSARRIRRLRCIGTGITSRSVGL
jgi:hypothetical protein